MSRRGGRTDGPTEEVRLIYGVHPVTELILAQPRSVDRIFATSERRSGLGRVLRQAREAGIPVTHLSRELLARKLGRQALHQGIAAQVAPVTYATLDELADPRGAPLLVLADRVVDPRNLGAVIRTGAAAGVRGVILGDGCAGITPVVSKTAAGAVDRLTLAREIRTGAALELLGRAGFDVVALDPRGDVSWDRARLDGPVVLVVGGEGRGLRPSVVQRCNIRVAIPMAEGVDSLNLAVSLGVLLFEAVRQRRGGHP